MTFVSVDTYTLDDRTGTMVPNPAVNALMDEDDYAYFNSHTFYCGIYAANHIYTSDKTDNYAMIVGPKLTHAGEIDEAYVNDPKSWFSQKLHLQVARRSGFNCDAYTSFYVIHHVNHNRMDARRCNLVGMPEYLNIMMQTTARCFIGVRKTGATFGITVRIGGIRDTRIHKTYQTETEAAVAWVQLMCDYMEIMDRLWVPVYRCHLQRLEPVHALYYTYVMDAKKEYKNDRINIFRLAMAGMKNKMRRRLELRQDDEVAMLFNGKVEEIIRRSKSQKARDAEFSRMFKDVEEEQCVNAVENVIFFPEAKENGDAERLSV